MGASQGESIFTIVTFDENLQMTSHPGPALAGASCPLAGMVVGRFDPPPQNGEIDFNPQIATLIGSASGCAAAMSSPFVELFTVNSTTFDSELVPGSRFAVTDVTDEARLSLAVGDTQGRSLRLGEPQKVTITSHMQPEVILGVPPMHVDFITPANGTGPTVLNLSADPDGFFSGYETMIKSSNQSSRKSTTSYSFSTKETAGQTVSFGIPFIDSISVSAKEAAEQTHKNVVTKTFDTYASRAFDASTTTGFGDQIWFSQKRFNVYSYPVIGD